MRKFFPFHINSNKQNKIEYLDLIAPNQQLEVQKYQPSLAYLTLVTNKCAILPILPELLTCEEYTLLYLHLLFISKYENKTPL